MDRPRHLRLVPPPDASVGEPSDEARAALAAAGQVAAWIQLVHRHEHTVLGFAAALTDAPVEAAADARDAFLRLWERRRTFGPDTPVRELLLREVLRRADRFRLIPARRPAESILAEPAAPAEPAVPHREDDAKQFRRLDATWRLLPRPTRAVLHLVFALELPADAVARITGLPPARVTRVQADGLALLAVPGVEDVARRVGQLAGLRSAAVATPVADTVVERLHAPHGQRHVVASAVAVATAAIVTMLAFFMKGPFEDPAWSALEAMGPLSEAVFPRWQRGDARLPDGAAVNAGDMVTLTLDNHATDPLHVLVIAFDAAGTLHFLAPAELDPDLDPVSIPVPANRSFELPAITVPADATTGDWRLAVLVSRHPRAIRATRSALHMLTSPDPARLQRLLPETTVLVHRLRVRGLTGR